MNVTKKTILLTAAALPISLLMPTQISFAQENNSVTKDEIVVTGSRIRRSNINTAIPVQGLDIGEIESSGTVDVGELLTQIPGVEYSLSPESTGLSTQNPGLSTINLRGLGGDRTLVLINGRRAVSNSGNGERVSTDTIPSGFVKKIEVTTGGASAIYGADAIAGVANFILRDSFEGVRAGYRYGAADASGEVENTIDLTIGKNFADDRGNIMLGVTYDDETAVFADATRPDSIAPIGFNADPANCVVAGSTQCGTNLSSFLPGGRFEGDDAWNVGGVWFNDKSLAPQDGRVASVGFETGLDGFNFRPGRTLSPAVETLALAGKARFDLNDAVTAFAEAYYTQVDSTTVNAPRTASSGTDIGPAGNSIDIGRMSSSHPFIPPEVEETRSGSVSWARRFVEVGMDIKENERNTLRTAAGLKGSMENGWDWTAYATYGKYEQEQTQLNALNYQNIRNALRIESDGASGFQCTDADARAAGCIPLNIFGEGSITEAMADYIRYTGRLEQERSQTTVAGNMNGDVYELPAGTMKAAFGFEYRKESQTTVGDPDVGAAASPGGAPEQTSISVIPSIDASFDVIEGFGELDIPIIMDRPGIHALSAQLAGRIGNYSTIGTIFSYNVGGSYAPSEDIRFRAQYSRSQRAPNITEFFSDKRGDFDSLDDPCDGLNADGTGLDTTNPNVAAFTANCLAEAGIQAYFADPANAGLAFDAGGSSVFGPNAGNNQLEEETADTFTIGAIFTPQALPDFSFIVDYYRINIDGAIGTISTQTTVDLCYAAASFPNNRFCGVITRDASTGEVIEVVNREENLNKVLAEGIDVTMKYAVQPETIPGDFDMSLIYTHSLSNEAEFEGLTGSELSDFNGEIGTPKDRFRAKFGWDLNEFRLAYTWHYQSGGVDDITLAPTDIGYFDTGSQSYHDIYARYKFDNKYNAQVYAGIKNIANKFGPVVPSGLDHGNTRNIISNVNRPIGREFYAGVRVNW
ncbi:MAG: TonB-dependent receptor [Robiginitomaculum sp.]|nr:TonB-dependent receptor [Robiginitomaculum sp.]